MDTWLSIFSLKQPKRTTTKTSIQQTQHPVGRPQTYISDQTTGMTATNRTVEWLS